MLARALEPCAALADVGTDHAYLPLAAVNRGIARRAWAIDLREAPLEGARRHVQRAGLEDRVILLRGNGLQALEERTPDAVTIAGMSGDSMVAILEAARGRFQAPWREGAGRVRQLVVQPNQNAHLVRAWALSAGLRLEDERMLESRGRFFVACAFRLPSEAELSAGGVDSGLGGDPAYRVEGFSEADLFHLGPLLLARRDPTARRYFEAQRARLTRWAKREPTRHEGELARWIAACARFG